MSDTPVKTVPAAPGSASRFWRLYTAYLVATALLMLPSSRLWWRLPFEVLKHNFDFFTFGNPAGLPWLVVAGRVTQALLLTVMGWLFFRLATRHRQTLEALDRPRWIFVMLAPCLICFAGLPWMNPDVFYYIGEGWLESHYDGDAYGYPIVALEGFRGDEMFHNIDPPLMHNRGNYGPLHQNLCATLAGLSGGNIRLALLLFKLANLGFLLGSAALVYLLAREWKLAARHLSFCYLCNPIVPICFLTWVHNDAQQNFFLLLMLFCAQRRRPFLAGCSLAVAVSFKYAGVVLLPALLVYWLLSRQDRLLPFSRRCARAGLCLSGFAVAFALPYALYANAWDDTVRLFTTNWSPYRSSIYSLLTPQAAWLHHSLPRVLLKKVLTPVFVAVGGVITLYPLARRRELDLHDFAKQAFWLYMAYFIICSPAVLEWYLTWFLGFAFFCRDARCFRFTIALFSFYLPLVIFTEYQNPFVMLSAQIVLYLLVAGGAAVYFRRREDEAPEGVALPAWFPVAEETHDSSGMDGRRLID